MNKLLTRDNFRELVFARDKYKCVICEQKAVDAHHLLDRKLFKDGGYYLDNGASVCESCHILCERTIISVETVRRMAKITNVVVPDDMDHFKSYDKWGNVIMGPTLRRAGKMGNDEGVQKILKDVRVILIGVGKDENK